MIKKVFNDSFSDEDTIEVRYNGNTYCLASNQDGEETLIEFDQEDFEHFITEMQNLLEELAKENKENYLKKQLQWCKDNGIKKGSKVKIVGTSETGEQGWANSWGITMDSYLGRIGTVRKFDSEEGIYFDETSYGWPYFVLEKVETYKLGDEVLVGDRPGKIIKTYRRCPVKVGILELETDITFCDPIQVKDCDNITQKEVEQMAYGCEVRKAK